MTSIKRQKVRFTGKRTGLERIAVPGLGVVSQGTVVEIDADVADAWLAITNPAGVSDWAAVGDDFKASDDEIATADQKQQDRLAEKAAEAEGEGDEPPSKEAKPEK